MLASSANSYVPQCGAARAQSVRASFLIWGTLAIIALVPVAAIIAAPLLIASGHAASALTIYDLFSYVCHQLPERSFHVDGHKFAVCSRCTGIYLGFALSVLLYPLARSLQRVDTPSRLWLFVAAAPIIIDWALGAFGLWDNTHLSRFLTGALFSAVAAVYVVPGVLDVVLSLGRRFGVTSGNHDQPVAASDASRRTAALPSSAPSDYSSPARRI